MKIIDIELKQYRWERGTPIRNGKHTYTYSGLNLICVHTDAGVSGIGWRTSRRRPAWPRWRRDCWSISNRL